MDDGVRTGANACRAWRAYERAMWLCCLLLAPAEVVVRVGAALRALHDGQAAWLALWLLGTVGLEALFIVGMWNQRRWLYNLALPMFLLCAPPPGFFEFQPPWINAAMLASQLVVLISVAALKRHLHTRRRTSPAAPSTMIGEHRRGNA